MKLNLEKLTINSMKFIFVLLMILCGLWGKNAVAQEKTKVEILNSNRLDLIRVDGMNVRRLRGDVRFRQGGVIMRCDSAYQYLDNNEIDAFDNVVITQGDSMRLTGDFLNYNSESRQARITGEKVVMVEKSMTLTTTVMNYNFENQMASYPVFGKLETDDNVLTSKKGSYHSPSKMAYFKDSVVLVNPDYEMHSDTLEYSPEAEIAYFFGPTFIYSDDNTIYCENGWYDTKQNKSKFGKNAYIQTKEQQLFGDSIFFDRAKDYGRAVGNVAAVDTAEQMTLRGQYGELFDNGDVTYITDSVLLEKYYGEDTVFVHADTLLATYDSTGENRLIRAFYGVKTYSKDFQAVCDSLSYPLRDSLMKLYDEPIFWSEEYQITAEFMEIKIIDNKVDKFYLYRECLIISEVVEERYNQVRGKEMIGYVFDNELKRIKVFGNGESIYYVLDEDDLFIGVNEIESSDMDIRMENQTLKGINFINQPKATLSPIGMRPPLELRLKGFHWQPHRRPKSVEDLFL